MFIQLRMFPWELFSRGKVLCSFGDCGDYKSWLALLASCHDIGVTHSDSQSYFKLTQLGKNAR